MNWRDEKRTQRHEFVTRRDEDFVQNLTAYSLIIDGFRPKALLGLLEEKTVSSAVLCGSDRLTCCLIVGIHALCMRGEEEKGKIHQLSYLASG